MCLVISSRRVWPRVVSPFLLFSAASRTIFATIYKQLSTTTITTAWSNFRPGQSSTFSRVAMLIMIGAQKGMSSDRLLAKPSPSAHCPMSVSNKCAGVCVCACVPASCLHFVDHRVDDTLCWLKKEREHTQPGRISVCAII